MKKLDEVLNLYYEYHPDTINIKNWSGCNYHINQGNNEVEPVGTAQSMHDCEGCNAVSHCEVKQATPIWEWNEEIEKDLKNKWNKMKKVN